MENSRLYVFGTWKNVLLSTTSSSTTRAMLSSHAFLYACLLHLVTLITVVLQLQL